MFAPITITHYLIVSAILFFIGAVGVIARRQILIVLMSIELMLNAVNLTIIAFSRYYYENTGHVVTLFVMAVAAAEVAVGLAIFLNVSRQRGATKVDELDTMKH